MYHSVQTGYRFILFSFQNFNRNQIPVNQNKLHPKYQIHSKYSKPLAILHDQNTRKKRDLASSKKREKRREICRPNPELATGQPQPNATGSSSRRRRMVIITIDSSSSIPAPNTKAHTRDRFPWAFFLSLLFLSFSPTRIHHQPNGHI